MTLQPINRKAIESALIAWAESATGLVGRVIPANAAGPQPDFPYVTISLGTTRRIGHDEQAINAEPDDARPGAEVAIEGRGQRVITMSVNTYSMTEDADEDACAIMDRLVASVALDEYMRPLTEAGCAIGDIGQAQRLDALMSTTFRQRQQCDFAVNVAANFEERVTYIETVQATNEIVTPAVAVNLQVSEG